MEVHARVPHRKQGEGDNGSCESDSHSMHCRPGAASPERDSKLVNEEQHAHGQQEHVSGDIMPPS